MTALHDYARLETSGLWREAPGAVARSVTVSLGDATLVLSGEGGALAHWSLPALHRLNPGGTPARYAPDEAGTETLDIEDDTVTEAIERVRAAVARRAAPPRRLRVPSLLALLALSLALAALRGPAFLEARALAVMPQAQQAEIGATLLGHLSESFGPACQEPLGVEALAGLMEATFGPAPGQAVVLPAGPPRPLALPGGILALGRASVEDAAEPADLAADLRAARAAAPDPLRALLDDVGPWAVLRLLLSGDLPPAALAAHAARLAAAPPGGAGVPPLPSPLTDGEWVSLQGICGG